MRCDPSQFKTIFAPQILGAGSKAQSGAAAYSDKDFMHRDYPELMQAVADIRLALKGERAVRECAVAKEFVSLPEAMINASGDVDARKARAYLLRGSYPEVVKFTRDMNVGKVFRKPSTFTGYQGVKDDLRFEIDGADTGGLTFKEFTRWMVREKLATGLSGVYVQLNAAGKICFRRYAAENIINWSSGKQHYNSIVLKEDVPANERGEFSQETTPRLRHLSLIDGQAFETIWTFDAASREYKRGKAVPLMVAGRALTALPFVFDGIAGDFCPPLDSLFRLSISAYQASCELNHVHWKCSQPQAFITFDEGGHIGPSGTFDGAADDDEWVWGEGIKQIYKGELRYAELDGASLEALETRHENILREMAAKGARLGVTYGSSRVSEMTERMQQGGELAFIAGHILTTSEAVQSCIRWGLVLSGISAAQAGQVSFTLNTNLFEDRSEPSMDDIDRAVAGGHISRRTAFDSVRKALGLPNEVKFDEEQVLLRGE